EVFAERNVPLIPLPDGATACATEITGPASGSTSASSVRCLITAGDGRAEALRGLARGGEVAVSEVAQVWLADHRIGGRAVVPLAVVCDWMLRLVDEPGAVVLQDVDVLRGIAAP